MAGTGIVNINSDEAYAISFANLKSGTRYYDPIYGSDYRQPEGYLGSAYSASIKAMNAAGMSAGTTDKAIIPIYLDPKIIDHSRKFTPLVEIIPRVTNMGLTAEYSYLVKGSATTAAEDAALAEVNDTYTRASVPIKYLYAVGRVTGQAIAAVPNFLLSGITASGGTPEGTFGDTAAPNALQLEILSKTRQIKELEENLIINGSVSSSVGSGPNGTEFNGIIALMSTTNTVDKGTTALGLDDVNTAIRYAFDDGGRPNLAVCSSDVYTDLQNLISAKFGYMTAEKNVYWGFTTLTLRTMVGEVPVIPSMFMSNASGSKAIYFLDMSVVEMRVLQDMTFERLAKVNDSEKFFLKIYECLIIKNTEFCSSITAISG